jgi:hypothetical protein
MPLPRRRPRSSTIGRNTDPADFKALGQRWLATDKHQGTGGYEVQVYDAFADGLVFMRVFGGIRCYDLRASRGK